MSYPATRFLLLLKKKGVDVRTDLFTVEDVRREILTVMGGKSHA